MKGFDNKLTCPCYISADHFPVLLSDRNKKPNYCKKGFEVSKVKFKLVFHSCEVYHKGKHKLLNQEVLMLFGNLHETLVPLFSRDNG